MGDEVVSESLMYSSSIQWKEVALLNHGSLAKSCLRAQEANRKEEMSHTSLLQPKALQIFLKCPL